MAKELKELVSLFGEFRTALPEITGALNEQRACSSQDGAVLAKYKIMGKVLMAVSARCEPCIEYYAREAKRAGVTQDEFMEFMGVAVTMAGCIGEIWAIKAYAYFKEAKAAQQTQEPTCCATQNP